MNTVCLSRWFLQVCVLWLSARISFAKVNGRVANWMNNNIVGRIDWTKIVDIFGWVLRWFAKNQSFWHFWNFSSKKVPLKEPLWKTLSQRNVLQNQTCWVKHWWKRCTPIVFEVLYFDQLSLCNLNADLVTFGWAILIWKGQIAKKYFFWNVFTSRQ